MKSNVYNFQRFCNSGFEYEIDIALEQRNSKAKDNSKKNSPLIFLSCFVILPLLTTVHSAQRGLQNGCASRVRMDVESKLSCPGICLGWY